MILYPEATMNMRMSTSTDRNRCTVDLQSENEHLKQQNQWIYDILAFTGHELSNRLQRLTLDSQKLALQVESALNAQQKETLARINRNAVSIAAISRNYLRLAQLESTDFNPCPSLVDPKRDIFQPLMNEYADHLAEREQTCELRIAWPELLLWADRGLLYSACDNLLNNAIKYGAQGGRINITVTECGLLSEISIWNSGPGIDPVYVENLFRRFFRGSHDDGSTGTGIGLYLAHRIAEAHRGRLRVESLPGAWAEFTFTLPKRENSQSVRPLATCQGRS